jgi:hypothetical protein
MFDLFFISLMALSYQVQGSFNKDPDSVTLGQINASGQIVAISPTDLMIAVGFSDGTLKIFDTKLIQLCEVSSKNNSKLLDITWLPNLGLLTLDSFNRVNLWSNSCQLVNTIKLSKNATGII